MRRRVVVSEDDGDDDDDLDEEDAAMLAAIRARMEADLDSEDEEMRDASEEREVLNGEEVEEAAAGAVVQLGDAASANGSSSSESLPSDVPVRTRDAPVLAAPVVEAEPTVTRQPVGRRRGSSAPRGAGVASRQTSRLQQREPSPTPPSGRRFYRALVVAPGQEGFPRDWIATGRSSSWSQVWKAQRRPDVDPDRLSDLWASSDEAEVDARERAREIEVVPARP